jgi:chemotaxis protein methyltransferase CheR
MDPYVEFTRAFYQFTGIDLQCYKRPQMERRLTSLRNKHGYADFAAYVRALKENPELLDEVLDRMTINVSEFLRNRDRWEAIVPHLRALAERAAGELSIWSAACSTGEEPYTIAMLMEEHVRRPYRILATDIDKRVLYLAQLGEYKAHQVKSVPQDYLDKYFEHVDQTWYISPALKERVQFRRHNLLADPYPDSLDLIVCRNVLIYFTDEAKQRVIDGFARALKPGGLLFVGSTEPFLHNKSGALHSVGPFLYQRKDA